VNLDLNALSPEEILELAYALLDEDGVEKTASEDLDLNELSVDEFLEFAEGLEEEMVKTAGPRWEAAKRFGRKARSEIGGAFSAREARAGWAGRHGGPTGSTLINREDAENVRSLAHKMMLRGAAKTTAAYGGSAAAVGGGIAAYRNRNKKKGK